MAKRPRGRRARRRRGPLGDGGMDVSPETTDGPARCRRWEVSLRSRRGLVEVSSRSRRGLVEVSPRSR
eukprot:432852-Lingulodinium_polyedra.AAC.1